MFRVTIYRIKVYGSQRLYLEREIELPFPPRADMWISLPGGDEAGPFEHIGWDMTSQRFIAHEPVALIQTTSDLEWVEQTGREYEALGWKKF